MKINPFFWKDYPIEIEKEEYEEVSIILIQVIEDTLDLSMIQPKNNGKQQIKKPLIQKKIDIRNQSKYKNIVDPKISHEAIKSHFKFNDSHVKLAEVSDR